MTYNYVDIAIAVIFLFTMVEGYIRGLVRSLLGILGYIAAFIVARMYYDDVANWLTENVEWFTSMKAGIVERMQTTFTQNASMTQAIENGSTAELSQALQNDSMLDQLQLPEGIQDQVVDFANGMDLAAGQQNAIQHVASMLADGILYGISFMLIVLGVLLTIKIIGLVLDGMTELPVIKQANKFGGFLFGIAKGALIVFIAMTLAAFTAPLTTDLNIISTIHDSQVGIWFYNNNILLILLDILL